MVFPSVALLVVAVLGVIVGAAVQSSLGFGMGLVSLPALGLSVPERLPQTVVLLALPLTVLMLWEGRDALRSDRVGWLLAGRVVGVFPAMAVLLVIDPRALQVLIGVVTLAVVATMAASREGTVRATPVTQLTAGTASGFVGSAAGLGGPPIALLYAGREGRERRAVLALVLLFGNVVSLVGYAAIGRLDRADLLLAAVLLVPLLLGLRWGSWLRPRVDGSSARRAVLVAVAVSAVVLVLRATFV